MTTYEVIEDAVRVNGETCSAVYINSQYIPIIKDQIIETKLRDGYRIIEANGVEYQMHRSVHEIGRPELLEAVLEIMKALIV